MENGQDALMKARRMMDMGRHEEALRLYGQILEADPSNIKAWEYKGDIFYELGRHEEAIECYDRILSMDNRNLIALYKKGYTLRKIRRFPEAIAAFDQALEIDPDYSYALNEKGYSLNELSRYDEAIACFDRSLAANRAISGSLPPGNRTQGIRPAGGFDPVFRPGPGVQRHQCLRLLPEINRTSHAGPKRRGRGMHQND